MKVKVVSVANRSFDGKDGKVLGASLTFEDNGQQKELIGYGPALSAVFAWKPGEEHEIETFETAEGKSRFRLPREPGQRRGGFEAAFRNTKEGQEYEQKRMDRRTALMQAVAYQGTAGSIPDVIKAADEFDAWLCGNRGEPW